MRQPFPARRVALAALSSLSSLVLLCAVALAPAAAAPQTPDAEVEAFYDQVEGRCAARRAQIQAALPALDAEAFCRCVALMHASSTPSTLYPQVLALYRSGASAVSDRSIVDQDIRATQVCAVIGTLGDDDEWGADIDDD